MNNNEEKFISSNLMIDRDVPDKKILDIWQIQANKNDNYANIIYIGKFSYIPIVPITKFDFKEYNCELMSYCITSDEINKGKIKMIGFIINKDEKILSSFNMYFVPDVKFCLTGLLSETRIKGHFEIIHETLKKKIKIKEFDEYVGREESVYIMTELLTDIL